MTDVTAGVEYNINVDGKSFLMNEKKFNLLTYINETGSITDAAKLSKVSYRTALNYIDKMESTLDIAVRIADIEGMQKDQCHHGAPQGNQ